MIEAEHLTKYYGDFMAISDVTFKVNKGEILGFLGPNAAGKTTTMRILTGFLPPTEGTARVAGYDITTQSLEARRHIGYLPESVPLYTDMTIRDYLDYKGTLRGMSGAKRKQRVDYVIDRLKLGEYRNALIGRLSKGYKQRVGIAQAILHDPDVLILDEPTIGIDPIQVVETRQLIKSLAAEHTVILSTHILPEVSVTCGRVIIIHEGRIIAVDKPENLSTKLRGSERVKVEVRGPVKEVVAKLKLIEGVREVTTEPADGVNSIVLECKPGSNLREQIAAAIVKNGWGLQSLQAQRMTLEDIFLHLTAAEEAETA